MNKIKLIQIEYKNWKFVKKKKQKRKGERKKVAYKHRRDEKKKRILFWEEQKAENHREGRFEGDQIAHSPSPFCSIFLRL